MAELYRRQKRLDESLEIIKQSLKVMYQAGIDKRIIEAAEHEKERIIAAIEGRESVQSLNTPIASHIMQAQSNLIDEIEEMDIDPLGKFIIISYEQAKRNWQTFAISESYIAFCAWVREQFSDAGRGCVYVTHNSISYIPQRKAYELLPIEINDKINSYNPEVEAVLAVEIIDKNDKRINYGLKPLL